MISSALLSLIPAAKTGAVEKALHTTFGTTTVDDATLLTGGLSTALLYKIIVDGTPYVMRLVMQADAFRDPTRHFTCMRIAADAGIAPPIRYLNVEDAISISDYIAGVPLRSHFTPDTLLPALADVIRRIHDAPLFPPLFDYLDELDRKIEQFRSMHLLPESATEQHFRLYAEIRRVYPRHTADVVSSHNDLNPGNLLFDGTTIWVVDWEAAFRSDRYIDLATIAQSFVFTREQEEVYLGAYFGKPPTEYQQARFFLMRQITYMAYAMIMMEIVAAGGKASYDSSMNVPSLRELYMQMGAGAVSLASGEGQFLYAKVMLGEALRGMQTERFTESLAVVAKHPAGAA